MSDELKDGGPAFPLACYLTRTDGSPGLQFSLPGLTVRDWFAGNAPAMPDSFERNTQLGLMSQGTDDQRTYQDIKWRYAYADLMLAERTRTK